MTPNEEIRHVMEVLEPLKGSRVPKGEKLHVTLSFLDEINDSEKKAICTILSAVEAKSFEMAATHVGAFPDLGRARVAFIGFESPELIELHHNLMRMLPEKFRETRKFVPHLTVSRFKAPMDIEGLYRESEGKDFGRYRIDRVTLYKSELTPDGAIYTEICSVQLI